MVVDRIESDGTKGVFHSAATFLPHAESTIESGVGILISVWKTRADLICRLQSLSETLHQDLCRTLLEEILKCAHEIFPTGNATFPLKRRVVVWKRL